MTSTIKAIILATLFQVAAMVGLVAYMSNHDTGIAKGYALMAESNARLYTDTRNLELYNRLQQERNADRLDMQVWLEKQITLQLLKRSHE